MEKTPETDPSMIVEKEFQRKYTTKEIPQIKDEFKNYISEDELNDLFEGKAGETTESEI